MKRFVDYCRKRNCINGVSEAVRSYSLQKYGKILCWNCQKLEELKEKFKPSKEELKQLEEYDRKFERIYG